MRALAILAVLIYRMIPARLRSLWSADSSSHKALSALRNGAPVGATLTRYAIPHFSMAWEPPSWDN